MKNQSFASIVKESVQYQQTQNFLGEGNAHVLWKGHVGSSIAFSAATFVQNNPQINLFILSDKEEAAYFFNDLENLVSEPISVVFFPASYKVPYQFEEIDNANVVARAEVLDKIASHKKTCIVTYPEAVFEKVPTRKNMDSLTMKIEVGQTYAIQFINELLLEFHFDSVDFVYEPGQFAIRGGIIDVYSYANEVPYRIEFFGDEVESIRTFDPASQLSLKEFKFFNILPNVQNELLSEGLTEIFSFLGKDTCIWLNDYERLRSVVDAEFEKASKIFSEKKFVLTPTPPNQLYVDALQLEKALDASSTIEWGLHSKWKNSEIIAFNFLPQTSFNKNFEMLRTDLLEKNKENYQCFLFSNQPKQIERLHQIFEDIGGGVTYENISFALHEGFVCPDWKVLCYTDHQVFERYHRFKLKEGFNQSKQALTLKELYNLHKGDYVTHIDHGVGMFSGLETIDVNGKPQEAVRLVYKDGDVLYVGIHSLHRISKFTGKEGSIPKVNKLGTQAWATLKNKTKKKIKELAFDLIQLYAKRKAQPGFAFSPDTYLQNELEASFMYEDTPDQFKATLDVKKDMESELPMDRLICGDVGFGKTEIAIRAAFKAVVDNKQVAVLVPTTILSMQHFRSFKERLKDFPCTIDYVNRFKSAKATTETLQKLANGNVDILIGTHALVSNKIKFKDLGLMIIDEEQKFGVSVKDKLKTIRTTVDTLTLTATPIPRTLQFSLMGARDLSIINTPPPNRQPVLTEVISFQEETLRDAIAYEVSRGGQVFFVNNRISNLMDISGMIQRLCPGVRVGIGHGQMDGQKLEKVMMDFMEGNYDVLLATTIIESGIDISNANTIIINEAHQFGLSDLHQLRGRVGRSNKKGFCYLIAPRFSVLNSEARKRLEALVQFSDLGSGFNIAMKDLDIRGAGNMLGGEQSGFISEIGFEMYQKILNEALQELKENEFKDLFDDRQSDTFLEFVQDCVFETDFEVRFPDTYVNNVAERLSLYQSMDGLKNEAELELFRKELVDRFGPLPTAAKELLFSFQLRWLAQALGIERLVIKSEKMVAYFLANPQSPFYETETFTNLLNTILAKGTGYRLVQNNDRLRLVVEPVRHIKDAFEKLLALK
jgi:transcription-repair coupling factor (superfamily II helicase)